jgi:hypothetical protein
MSQPAKKGGPNAVQMLVILVAFVALAYYGFFSLIARDPLWFLKGFVEEPSLIFVYHDGQRMELRPGDAGFDELASAVQSSLGQGFARLTQIGFSDTTLQEAYTQNLTLEVFFARPIELHTWFFTGPTTQLLFPISGRHADESVVLLGEKGQYRVGAPVMLDMAPIQEALRSLGYY